MQSVIESFGRNEYLDVRQIRKIQLCAEELASNGLKAVAADSFPATLYVTHNDDDAISIILEYAGERNNIVDRLDDISLPIINGMTKDISYMYDKNNRVEAKLSL